MTSTLDITRVYAKRMRKRKNTETSTLELIHEVELLINTENKYEKMLHCLKYKIHQNQITQQQ